MDRRPSPPVLIGASIVHLIVTVLTWRDIARRPAESIRGGKNLWRIASVANTGNALLYWLAARRR